MFETKYHTEDLSEFNFLVTGGAGFIGSNLVEYLLKYGARKVRVLDNFSTGFHHNIDEFKDNPAFELVEGDICSIDVCKRAVEGIDYVFHEAALGSVPRSIKDPITSNEVNVSGFLNILVSSRDAKIKRFVYAASSSTYGDSKELPKVEERIGKPLSPYAITKYVNELYADVFSKTYGIETIGLRYFNVFGPKQNPDGSYAAVIPKFVIQLMKHQSPIINGDGEYSRDFTFVENVVQANVLAAFVSDSEAINNVYNVACGERNTLNQLTEHLKELLSKYDPEVNKTEIKHGPNRLGDIPHSLASVEKVQKYLNYRPLVDLKSGLQKAIDWYVNNL
jgi:UDP-N-acetylglucosamine 4-epimerase